MSLIYLQDVCPNEYRSKIELVHAVILEFKVAEERLMKLARGPERSDNLSEEPSYWANLTN